MAKIGCVEVAFVGHDDLDIRACRVGFGFSRRVRDRSQLMCVDEDE